MFAHNFATSSLAVLAMAVLATAAPANVQRQAAPELSLTAQLQLADVVLDRYSLLPNNSDWKFDFNTNPMSNRATFPALVGSGVGLAMMPIEACGLIPVHIHPRASEYLAVISGRLEVEAVPESGAVDADGKQRVIRNELGALQGTVFYQGTFHTAINPDCTPTLALAAFSSEDPGVNGIAYSFFDLSNEIIENQLGNALNDGQLDALRQALPTMRIRAQDCVARCGL